MLLNPHVAKLQCLGKTIQTKLTSSSRLRLKSNNFIKHAWQVSCFVWVWNFVCYCDVSIQIEGEDPSVVGCYCTVLLGCWGQYWTASPERLARSAEVDWSQWRYGGSYIADTANEEWCCVRGDGTAVCDWDTVRAQVWQLHNIWGIKIVWIASHTGHSLRQKTPKERKLYSCVDTNGAQGKPPNDVTPLGAALSN